MARLPRLVIPGHSHYVTQRGNRCGQTFLEDSDYFLSWNLFAEMARKADADNRLLPDAQIRSYHLVPSDEDRLRRTVANSQSRYNCYVNTRFRIVGASVVMDEEHFAHTRSLYLSTWCVLSLSNALRNGLGRVLQPFLLARMRL